MPLTDGPETGRDGTLRLVLESVAVDVSEAGAGPSRILCVDHLSLEPGASLGLTGPSGAGKTTLLHVIAGIVRPTVGRVLWGDRDLAGLSESARDKWRRDTVGFVFQEFQLIPELGILANVLLPATFAGFRPRGEVSQRARDLLTLVGLKQVRRRVGSLSRGEQQRLAIARALLHSPKIILADEPTASLDARNAETVSALLLAAVRESGATLLLASHDPALLKGLDRVVRLEAGHLGEGRKSAP